MVQTSPVTASDSARMALVEQRVSKLDHNLETLTLAVQSLVKNEAVAEQRMSALSDDIRTLMKGFETYVRDQAKAPRPFPLKEVAGALFGLMAITTTVVQVANWWQAQALTSVEMRLGDTDLRVLEYRLQQLEKGRTP